MTEDLYIVFEVECHTKVGQEVFLLGNCSELGYWNVGFKN